MACPAKFQFANEFGITRKEGVFSTIDVRHVLNETERCACVPLVKKLKLCESITKKLPKGNNHHSCGSRNRGRIWVLRGNNYSRCCDRGQDLWESRLQPLVHSRISIRLHRRLRCPGTSCSEDGSYRCSDHWTPIEPISQAWHRSNSHGCRSCSSECNLLLLWKWKYLSSRLHRFLHRHGK